MVQRLRPSDGPHEKRCSLPLLTVRNPIDIMAPRVEARMLTESHGIGRRYPKDVDTQFGHVIGMYGAP